MGQDVFESAETLNLCRHVLETLPVGVFVINQNGAPVYANDVAKSLLGKGILPEAKGHLGEVYDAYTEDGKPYPQSRMPILRALNGEHFQVDDMFIGHGDHRIRLEVFGSPIYGAEGDVLYASAVFKDITRLHLAEQRASHDSLTGLPNRSALDQQLSHVIQKGQIGLLFLDIDRLKSVNDKHSHGVGDRVLQILAKRILKTTRESEHAFRLGGDEFIVICEGIITGEQLDTIANRLRDAIMHPIHIDSLTLVVDVSVGRARSGESPKSPDALIANADADMYRRKQKRYARYTD